MSTTTRPRGADGIGDTDLVGPRTERDLRRFEAYCRWSLHLMIGACALLVVVSLLAATVGASGDLGPVVAAVGVGVTLVWTAACVAVVELACSETPVPRPVLALFVVTSLVVGIGFAAFMPPGALRSEGAGPFVGLGPIGLGASVGVASLVMSWRRAALAGATGIGLLAAVYTVGPPHLSIGGVVALVVMAFWFVLAGVPMTMSTRWMIDVVRRLWRSRQVAADLAVAEERLRFSRDLHDVFGRTLSTVTVKSELAAELARRGDARAVGEMEAVRQIAQTALTDVRGLVRGYRRIDLAGELAGARGLLRAGGFRAAVTGTAEDLTTRVTPAAADALAWVVREGVTNVLRHGRGGDVRLALTDEGATVALTIENPARAGEPGRDGTGLVGLRERLETVGGALTVDRDGGSFRLRACVPTHPPTTA